MKEAGWRENPNVTGPAVIDKSPVPDPDTAVERHVQAWVDAEKLVFG
jgi:hypothetical protein